MQLALQRYSWERQTVMASLTAGMAENYTVTRNCRPMCSKKNGFNGFVVGDWNGHGQVPGCTNTDRAQSFNAGVDMFMAPDS